MPRLNSTRKIDGEVFVLAEQIGDYRTAALAQAEYWAEGYCCRREIIDGGKTLVPHYNLWVGPPRKYAARTLPGEIITRNRSSRVIGVA